MKIDNNSNYAKIIVNCSVVVVVVVLENNLLKLTISLDFIHLMREMCKIPRGVNHLKFHGKMLAQFSFILWEWNVEINEKHILKDFVCVCVCGNAHFMFILCAASSQNYC